MAEITEEVEMIMKTLDEVIYWYENRRTTLIGRGTKEEMEDAILQYLKAYKDDRNELTALRAYWKEMHKDVRQKAEVNDENVG